MEILCGNYLKDQPGDITAVEYVGEEGECLVRTMFEHELAIPPFCKIDWKPLSIRGYHKFFSVPSNMHIDMSSARRMWNAVISENGAISFHASREARDKFLQGDL